MEKKSKNKPRWISNAPKTNLIERLSRNRNISSSTAIPKIFAIWKFGIIPGNRQNANIF